METQPQARGGTSSSLSRSVEAFARDLILLVRGVRIYPRGHPSLVGAAERLVAGAPWDAQGRLVLGSTRAELVIEGEFVGGKDTRAADLAALLHSRKVGRVVFTRRASPRELIELAALLSVPGLTGSDVRRELGSRGIVCVTVEPLDLERVHAAATPSTPQEGLAPADRRRQVWLWLQDAGATPEDLAGMLESRDLWPGSDGVAASDGGADGRTCALLLAGLGERLEAALELLPDGRRAAVLERVAEAGRSLTAADLLEFAASDDAGPRLRGQGASALLRDLDAERFVDLLAGLTALGDRGTRRLAGVFRRLAPPGGARQALSLVGARMLDGRDNGFALGVWKTVEEFLLRLEEDPFMAEDYSESLERVDQAPTAPALGRGDEIDEIDEIDEDPGPHLDGVFVGLAADGGRPWRERLTDRVAARLEEGGVFKGIDYATRVDELLPGLIDERPVLVRELFRRGLAAAREATAHETRKLVRFCRRHETLLLAIALRALEEEQRLASRRFLVEVLSSFSPAATPALVSRARSGPWYVARNLAMVLGRQGGPRALPVLRELLNHRHPKVRREASRALSGADPGAARSGAAGGGASHPSGRD
jgi:hypothetical protein